MQVEQHVVLGEQGHRRLAMRSSKSAGASRGKEVAIEVALARASRRFA
jgi:hypothetical protein